jgi:mannose-6-phosphate isomerase-like protein (cupin superfamily)
VWDPGSAGLLGGLVAQDASSDHGGERHLEGDELIVVISGTLTVVLLHDDESVSQRIALREDEATLVPQMVWHRIETAGVCRYIFFGGGRTEIKRG